MATAPEDRQYADQIEGAPHPRETPVLFGQDHAQAEFLDSFNTGRLHSGWMITGPRGVGKATLAWKIAAFLLAQPGVDQGGGLFGDAAPLPDRLDIDADHPDMRLLQSGAHPRLFLLRRGWNEKTDKLQAQISVEEVRKLKNFFGMSAADGGRRVVIVDAADEMNVNAANAILKLLEEPPAQSTILMVAHQPSRLLPTIRSRCRELRCGLLPPEEITQALTQADIHSDAPDALAALTGGSVGEAVRLVNLDGLALYSELIGVLEGIPNFDRPRAIKLADSCTGKAGETRFALLLDLLDQFLTRLARAGLMGPPAIQAAPGEARLLARLCPHDRAAREWATIAQAISERTRHGKAVNLDPASLVLDTLFRIEETARAALT